MLSPARHSLRQLLASFSFPAAALVATASLAAQSTLRVGPGEAYATITAAVAAAADGDTVLVLGGVHADDVLIQRGIRLIGRDAAMISDALLSARVRVQGIQAPRTFAMSGFRLLPPTPGSLNNSRRTLAIENCTGPVSIEELTVDASGPYASWELTLQGAPQVSLRATRFGSCRVFDSLAVIVGCRGGFRGNAGLPPLWVRGGSALVIGGEIDGADGLIPSPAVWLESGQLVATRATLRAGPATSLVPAVAAILANAGSLLLDPSAVLVPTGNAPPVQGGVAPLTREFASSLVALDPQRLRIESQGPAGVGFAITLSVAVPQVATPWGLAWVDLTSAALLAVPTYAADRSHVFTAALPPLPPGLTLAIQSVVFESMLTFSAPTIATTR